MRTITTVIGNQGTYHSRRSLFSSRPEIRMTNRQSLDVHTVDAKFGCHRATSAFSISWSILFASFCQVAFPFFASLTCALAHVNLLTAWHETRRDLTEGYQRQLAACVFSMACANPGLKILCWVIVGQTQHFSLDILEELECEIVLAVVKWRPTDIYVNAWWPAMRQVELHKCAVESTEAPNPFRLSEICKHENKINIEGSVNTTFRTCTTGTLKNLVLQMDANGRFQGIQPLNWPQGLASWKIIICTVYT